MGLAVAIVAAAAFLLWLMPQVGRGQSPEQTIIDTAAEVEAAQCASCHVELGAAKRPGLIFNHGNHLVVSCAGCHYEMPHKNGTTYSVPMEVCFTCHGLQHGPVGELATAECTKCHTKSFTLRPQNHTKDWAARPHATAGKRSGVNDCMMCHKAAKDCDVCHVKENVDVGPMPPTYQSIIIEKPKTDGVKIYPSQPPSMSQCVYCHPDLDNFKPGRLIFAHGTHLERNYKCTVCHSQFAHSPEQIQRPDMLSCYRCHGLVHAGQGLVATEACDKCHPPKFGLKPADHTKAFVKGTHKKRAGKEGEYCAMCHQSTFCVACHQGKKAAEGGPKKPVIPADHRKADWRSKHGGLFLAREGACGSCHDDPSCKRCHKTIMPHPTNWLTGHAQAGKLDSKDCNVCHIDRSSCQECHHGTVKRAQLIEKNCVPCHAEMRQKPATGIKNKGFAEHAVHFDVAKKKGEPYVCDDCHIGFATSTAGSHTDSLKQAGHDVRLCYGCHGYLDYRNVQIAPYPGVQLCLRCHSNLNI
jgi:hypothetical protein